MAECRICGGASNGERYVAREMMFGLRETFEYFKCQDCGCLQIVTIPEDLSPYYPSNYYSMSADVKRRGAGARTRGTLQSWFRLHVNNRLFGASRRTRIFDWMRGTNTDFGSAIVDVGCGGGKLLRELQEYGFRDLTGADPFVAAEQHEDGLVIRQCELSELERSFDLIMMHHTFEHVVAPERTMASAAARLRKDRFLLLRIPIVDCFAFRHYGVNWFALDAPRHLHLHTEKSIGVLAERTGFVVERISYDSGAHQLWGSEQYLRDIPHRSECSYEESPERSLFTAAQIEEYENRSAELNAARDGDAACFYLRRS